MQSGLRGDRLPAPVRAWMRGELLLAGVVLLLGAGCRAAPVPHDPVVAAARHTRDAERLMAAERWEQALKAWEKVLREDPFAYRVHVERATCYYQLRAWEEEIAEYRKALAINPAYPEALRRLGHALLVKDRLEEARSVYWRYLAQCPRDSRVLFNLAQLEGDLGDHAAEARLLQAFRALGKPAD